MADASYADIIADCGLFTELDHDEVLDLVEVCEHDRVIAGQALWAPGDPSEAGYILLEGRIEVTYRVQPDGQRTMQYSEPGSLFSINSLVGSWEHTSSGTAVERSEVLELTREGFDSLFNEQHPAAFVITDALADELVEEMRDANRRLHEVFGHPAETLRMLRRRSRETKRT